MAETVAAPEGKLLGANLGKLTVNELICLAKRLCETSVCQCDDKGFRGGFRPGNIYIADGIVTVGPPDKAGEDGWTKDILEYMAPEVFWNGKKTAKADVYSIGLIMFVGLNCGNVPFVPMADYKPTPEMRANALRTRMNGEKPELPASVDGLLRGIVERATEFDEDSRFETPLELLNALRVYCGEAPVDEVKCVAQPVKREAPAKKPAPVRRPTPPKPKPEPEPRKAPEKAPEPQASPVKKPKMQLTVHERKNRRLRASALTVIALILCAAAIAAESFDFSVTEPVLTTGPTVIATVEPTVKPTVEPTAEPEPTLSPTPTSAPYAVLEVIVEDISWDRAEQKCREMGGSLVTIKDAEEFADVCNMLMDSKADYVWIGCYRNNEGKLTWVDGTETDFYIWSSGEPSVTDAYDGASEDYIMLVRQSDGTWRYNDNRMDPFAKYAKYYSGKTAFICSHG